MNERLENLKSVKSEILNIRTGGVFDIKQSAGILKQMNEDPDEPLGIGGEGDPIAITRILTMVIERAIDDVNARLDSVACDMIRRISAEKRAQEPCDVFPDVDDKGLRLLPKGGNDD